jgi:hypothetical protein
MVIILREEIGLLSNPAIGYLLDWKLSGDGLFKWVNDKNEMMVESIWWMDGCVSRQPPDFDNELGEGWLVEASEAALDIIISRFGMLQQCISVKRSFYQNGEKLENPATLRQAIDRNFMP